MMNSVRFECVSMPNGVKGKLSKDKDGFYTMPVGGLNVYNSAGQYYVYDQAKKLFEQSSPFMRRVEKGVLRAEVGHPVKEPGMSEEDFVRRVLTIRESNVCAFFKEVWLDFDSIKDKNGRPVIAIMAKVCPSGPKGDFLAKAFEQNGENVCFSIRAFTNDVHRNGRLERELETIVTFDYVNEPGIDFAEKFKSPALESAIVTTNTIFRRSTIENALTSVHGIATESVSLSANELFKSFGWNVPTHKPIEQNYHNW